MTNREKWHAALLKEFTADPPQPLLIRGNTGTHIMPAKTPEQCADTFTTGIIEGGAGTTGPRIARACRALGIKQTRKAIREYCAAD